MVVFSPVVHRCAVGVGEFDVGGVVDARSMRSCVTLYLFPSLCMIIPSSGASSSFLPLSSTSLMRPNMSRHEPHLAANETSTLHTACQSSIYQFDSLAAENAHRCDPRPDAYLVKCQSILACVANVFQCRITKTFTKDTENLSAQVVSWSATRQKEQRLHKHRLRSTDSSLTIEEIGSCCSWTTSEV